MKRILNFAASLVVLGVSFAMPGMMGGPTRSGGTATNSTAAATTGVAGSGLPLLEVGIGLAILGALIWWFDLRKRGKKDV